MHRNRTADVQSEINNSEIIKIIPDAYGANFIKVIRSKVISLKKSYIVILEICLFRKCKFFLSTLIGSCRRFGKSTVTNSLR